jgi:hypothetical protein
MDDLIGRIRAAETTDVAVGILVDEGVDEAWARWFCAVERGDSPGDLVVVDDE